MHSLYKIEEMLFEFLDEIAEEDELSPGTLSMIKEATSSIKNIEKIDVMIADKDGNRKHHINYESEKKIKEHNSEYEHLNKKLEGFFGEEMTEKEKEMVGKWMCDLKHL
jgi:hypothetical protein